MPFVITIGMRPSLFFGILGMHCGENYYMKIKIMPKSLVAQILTGQVLHQAWDPRLDICPHWRKYDLTKKQEVKHISDMLCWCWKSGLWKQLPPNLLDLCNYSNNWNWETSKVLVQSIFVTVKLHFTLHQIIPGKITIDFINFDDNWLILSRIP